MVNAWIPDLDRVGRVHVVAIGGAAMSALAHILLAEGHPVSGSDQADSGLLDALRAAGAAVSVGHDAANVLGADLVAISSAVRPGNVESASAD